MLSGSFTRHAHRQLNYSFVESSANVALFLPLDTLLAFVIVSPLWWLSAVFGLTLSLCVEFGQYLLLAQRVSSPYGVASNTLGALIGGASVAFVRWVIRRRGRLKERRFTV